MRQALLVSVAAIALAAGSTLALSQGGNPGGAAPQGGAAPGGGAINANPSGPSGGAAGPMTREAPGAAQERPSGSKGAQERTQERTTPNQKATQERQDNQPGTQQRRVSMSPLDHDTRQAKGPELALGAFQNHSTAQVEGLTK